ncbi:MAG: hypothetical protein ACPLVI_07085 [Thermoplasmata archaeon]
MSRSKKLLTVLIIVMILAAYILFAYYNLWHSTYWGNAPQEPSVPIKDAIVNLSIIQNIYNNKSIYTYGLKNNSVANSNGNILLYLSQVYYWKNSASFLGIYYQKWKTPSQAYFPFKNDIIPNSTFGNYRVFLYREAYLPHYHESIILIYYNNYFINITGTYNFENLESLQKVAFAEMDLMLS